MGKNLQSRRLVVILHADIVGSTMLVQLDEAIAHNRFKQLFLISPKLSRLTVEWHTKYAVMLSLLSSS